MRKVFLLFSALTLISASYAQNVGIGTNTPGAKLDISSTNSGILIPRVALTAANSASPVTSPAASTMVYNTATAGSGGTAVSPGFYYWNGSAWIRVIDNTSLAGATTVSNTPGTNTISTTVNGVTGTAVTVPNIYTADGSLGSNRIVTLGANNLTLSSTTGNLVFAPSSTGAVGIGVSAPQTNLDVFGTQYIRDNATLGSVASGLKIVASGGSNYIESAGSAMGNGTGADLNFTTMNATNFWMTIKAGGNIGIGTTVPSAQLHTTGTVRFANYTSGLLAGDGTGTLTTPRTITGTSNQIDLTNGNAVSGNPTINIDPAYSATLKAPFAMTGGANISYIGGYFAWSNRFIVISNGNGSQFSTNGYFDINMPTSGTITGVGGAGNVTATTSGIPLSGWQALYYILPIGSGNGTVAANFRVASYTGAMSVPENWILLGIVNGDDGTLRTGTGVVVQPGQTWTSGIGMAQNSGNGNYIQNGTAAQSANYNITGTATIGSTLSVGGTSYFGGAVTGMMGNYPSNNMIRLTPNLHLNSGAGYAVILNWDNGTTGATQTLRIGNGAGSDVFYVYADGEAFTTNWWRSIGNTGWYNQTYGGGWNMTDNTWIRSYGSKNVYIDQFLRADNGIASGSVNNPGAGNIRAQNVSNQKGITVTDYQYRQGPGTGADNQWHTVTCSQGYAMVNFSVYANAQWDGDLRINCANLTNILGSSWGWYCGNYGCGNADNVTVVIDCPQNYIASGFQIYATGYLDYGGQLLCSPLNSGYTAGNYPGFQTANISPWNTGSDNITHWSECPAGTFVSGMQYYNSSYADGNLQLHCTGINFP